MEIKSFKFDFKKSSLNAKRLAGKFFRFWIRHNKAFFIIALLMVCGLGIYLFYQVLYEDQWSQEEKAQYISSQRKEVNLQEDKFKKVIEEIERKKEAYGDEFYLANDIFKPLE